jgi:hypothetical protein
VKIEKDTAFALAALTVVTLGAMYWLKNGVSQAATNLGGAVVDAAVGVPTGAVLAIGEAVGIPQTNMTACQQAMAEGRTWDASFACPASTWLKYVTTPTRKDTAMMNFDAGSGTGW